MEVNTLDLQPDPYKGVVYSNIVTPGEVIAKCTEFMRGHGAIQEDGALVAAVAGQVVRVNKLICIVPYQRRYVAEIGDVVVGRVTELGPRCWRVSIDGYQEAVMLLASIHLPGGVQRRRLTTDELKMRSFFSEGDLLSAEIHSFFHDGAAFLHIRSLRHGKLRNGVLLTVPPALIKRLKSHIFTLPCGVDVVLGRNGRIWVHISGSGEVKDDDTSFYPKENDRLSASEIQNISRVRNCIYSLSLSNVYLNPTSITKCYDLTLHLPIIDIPSDNVILTLSSEEFRSTCPA